MADQCLEVEEVLIGLIPAVVRNFWDVGPVARHLECLDFGIYYSLGGGFWLSKIDA